MHLDDQWRSLHRLGGFHADNPSNIMITRRFQSCCSNDSPGMINWTDASCCLAVNPMAFAEYQVSTIGHHKHSEFSSKTSAEDLKTVSSGGCGTTGHGVILDLSHLCRGD